MTIVADLIAALDGVTALGERNYRDSQVPQGTTFPYCSVFDGVSPLTSAMEGDGRSMAWRTTAQVDVWQPSVGEEDDELVPAIVSALNGLVLTPPLFRVYIDGVVRVPDDQDLSHHAISVRAARTS